MFWSRPNITSSSKFLYLYALFKLDSKSKSQFFVPVCSIQTGFEIQIVNCCTYMPCSNWIQNPNRKLLYLYAPFKLDSKSKSHNYVPLYARLDGLVNQTYWKASSKSSIASSNTSTQSTDFSYISPF